VTGVRIWNPHALLLVIWNDHIWLNIVSLPTRPSRNFLPPRTLLRPRNKAFVTERVAMQWHYLLLSRRIPATVSIPGPSLHALCSRTNPDGTCYFAAGTSSAYFDDSAQERVQPRSHFIQFPCQPPHTRLCGGQTITIYPFLILCAQEREVCGSHFGPSCTPSFPSPHGGRATKLYDGSLSFLIISNQERTVRVSHLGPSCTHSL